MRGRSRFRDKYAGMGEMASCRDHAVLALPVRGEGGWWVGGRKRLLTHMKISLQSDEKRDS